MLIRGIPAALILGVIYVYLTKWIPFIYLECLITMGYGAILGFIIGAGAESGNSRNKAQVGLVSTAIGLLAVLWVWVFYFHVHGGVWVLDPLGLLMLVTKLGSVQTMTVGRFSSSGITISGLGIYLIWLCEALMIIGFAIATAVQTIASHPFCENCMKWTESVPDGSIRMKPFDLNAFLAAVAEWNRTYFDALELAAPDDKEGFTLKFAHCPRCQNLIALSMDQLVHKVDKKGKVEELKTQPVMNLLIDRDLMQRLLVKKQTPLQPAPVLAEPHVGA